MDSATWGNEEDPVRRRQTLGTLPEPMLLRPSRTNLSSWRFFVRADFHDILSNRAPSPVLPTQSTCGTGGAKRSVHQARRFPSSHSYRLFTACSNASDENSLQLLFSRCAEVNELRFARSGFLMGEKPLVCRRYGCGRHGGARLLVARTRQFGHLALASTLQPQRP